jgi:hypothetical protein
VLKFGEFFRLNDAAEAESQRSRLIHNPNGIRWRFHLEDCAAGPLFKRAEKLVQQPLASDGLR